MKFLDKLKVVAEITELASRAYAVILEKRNQVEADSRVKALEQRVAELEKKK